MELYLIDLLWCSLSLLSIVIYWGESFAKAIGYDRWYSELAGFGKTRRIRSWTDVPKAWFRHFYMFAVAWTGAWLVFWYLLEHGAFTRLQLGLLAVSNYAVYSSEPPSMFDNILLRFMFTGQFSRPMNLKWHWVLKMYFNIYYNINFIFIYSLTLIYY